jgi:hypothetical protein
MTIIKIDAAKLTKGMSETEKRAVVGALKDMNMSNKNLGERVRHFLAGERDVVRLATGELQPDEKEVRLKFAESHCAQSVKDWIEDQGIDLETFIDANASEDRVGLCQLLGGKWIEDDTIVDWDSE